MTAAAVHVLSGRPLFFPFPSGALVHDCATCDAPCCRGAPLAIGRSRELLTIQQAQPRAALFAVPEASGSAMLALLPPREKCWFLDSRFRCRIENVIGREHKPAGCRIFPFSRLRGAGEVLVVLPDFTCPLRVYLPGDARVPPTTTSILSHDVLTLEMTRAQVPRSGHPELARPGDLLWEESLPLERRIQQESAAFFEAASYVPFAELQHQLTAQLLGPDARPAAMTALGADIRRFLAVAEEPTAAVVRDLVVLTSSLRLDDGGDPGPRPGAFLGGAESLARRALPGMLVALAVLVGVQSQLRGSRHSLRGVVDIWRQQGALLYTLAHLGARPLPVSQKALDKALAEVPLQREALVAVVRAIADNGRRSVAATVEEILRHQRDAFAPPLTADAVAMLHGLGHVLRRACTFTPI